MARNLRKPAPYEALKLTERDISILLNLARFRLMSTDQIQVAVGAPSRNALNKRLRELYGLSYIDRPEHQRVMFGYADKRPTVHALGDAGAECTGPQA